MTIFVGIFADYLSAWVLFCIMCYVMIAAIAIYGLLLIGAWIYIRLRK